MLTSLREQFRAAVVLAFGGPAFFSAVHAQGALPAADGPAVRVAPSKENVVAGELIGEWIADKDLSARLGGRSDHAGHGPIVFHTNRQAEQRIVAFLTKILAKVAATEPDQETREFLEAAQRVYLAGEVEFRGKKQDFALISVYGTPRLVFYDRNEDLESENVMLARDKEGDNDLLFLGGDFNNQSFGAFTRVSARASDSGQ